MDLPLSMTTSDGGYCMTIKIARVLSLCPPNYDQQWGLATYTERQQRQQEAPRDFTEALPVGVPHVFHP